MIQSVLPNSKSPPTEAPEGKGKAKSLEPGDGPSFREVLRSKKKQPRDVEEPGLGVVPNGPINPPVVNDPPPDPGTGDATGDPAACGGVSAVGSGAAVPAQTGVAQAAAAQAAGPQTAADSTAPTAAPAVTTETVSGVQPGEPPVCPPEGLAVQGAADEIAALAGEQPAPVDAAEIAEAFKTAAENTAAAAPSPVDEAVAAVVDPADQMANALEPAETSFAAAEVEKSVQPAAAPEIKPAEEKRAAQPNPAESPAVQTANPSTASRPDSAAVTAPRDPIRPVEGENSLLQQVTKNLQVTINQGQSSMRVHLNPHELGSIDIRLVSSQNGVGVVVLAEKAATGKMLEAQLGELRQSLQDIGVQISQLFVNQNPYPQTDGRLMFQQGQSQNGSRDARLGRGGGRESGSPEQEKKEHRYTVIDYRV